MSHQPVDTNISNGNVINYDDNKDSTPLTSSLPHPPPPAAGTSSLLPSAIGGPSGTGSGSSSGQRQGEQRDGRSSESDSLTPPPRPSQYELEAAGRKRKWSTLGYNDVEQESMERTTTGFHLALAQDQLETLFPDPPARFTSYEDAVKRLVPYHIWQTCDEELEGYVGQDEGKIKAKQAREDKEAADVLSRMTKINERFMKLRTRDAERPSPTVDLICMIKESTAVLREELSTVQAQLKVASAERNAIEMQERARQLERLKIEQAKREQEERRQAAMAAANTKHGSSSTSTSTMPVPARPAPAVAPPRPTPTQPTAPPQSAAAPASVAAPTTSSPAQPTPPRGRGRPKGSLGARNQAALNASIAQHGISVAPNGTSSSSTTPAPQQAPPASSVHSATQKPQSPARPSHGPQPAQASAPGAPSPAPNQPVASGTPRTTRANLNPEASNGTPAPSPAIPAGPMKGPVSISVPISAVPELLRAEVLSRDTDGSARAPATIARKTEDKKAVVLLIDLSRCTPKQLVTLAKILKVDTHQGGGGGGGAGTRDAVAQAAAPNHNGSS